MSWFGSSGSSQTVELDNKISDATSESIPNGEIDLSVALEITDIIRSKKIPPKQCMRSLKKRLTKVYHNPNLLILTLKLVDLCVKNGGTHFLVELSSKEFMDYLVDFIFKVQYNTKKAEVEEDSSKSGVGDFLLSLIKEWAILLKDKPNLGYVNQCYQELLDEGYEFPYLEINNGLSNTFVDSEAPPDWIDSNECMICYNPFSIMNRKHHCRSCGGVFCQAHSSHSLPLTSLGILEPVRVCDNCYERIKSRSNRKLKGINSTNRDTSSNTGDEDELIKKAIELSLKDTQIPSTKPQPSAQKDLPPEPNEDEDIKAAIAASLRDYEEEKKSRRPQNIVSEEAEAPQSEFYSNILPVSEQKHVRSDNGSVLQGVVKAPEIQSPSPPQSNDLTLLEEESINLFVSLMANMKNDANKQLSILNDNNLNELYNMVIMLKPKVNLALREAIERYEKCLQLNNKLSTITRLYDQFLESKLSQAYGVYSNPDGRLNSLGTKYSSELGQENTGAYSNILEKSEPFNYYNSQYSYGSMANTNEPEKYVERKQPSFYPQDSYGNALDYTGASGLQPSEPDFNSPEEMNSGSRKGSKHEFSVLTDKTTLHRSHDEAFSPSFPDYKGSFWNEDVYVPPPQVKRSTTEELTAARFPPVEDLPYPALLNFEADNSASRTSSLLDVSKQQEDLRATVVDVPLIEL